MDTSFNRQFDPLFSPPGWKGGSSSEKGQQVPPETPFTAAFRSFGTDDFEPAPPPFPSTSQPKPAGENLLIDLALSPPPPSSSSPPSLPPSGMKPLRLAQSAQTSSTVRRSSPLKFSIFEDSFDDSTGGAPFSSPSVPAVRVEEETENVFSTPLSAGRAKGRKWGVMSTIREEQKQKYRRRSRSLSPVKEWSSPLRDEGEAGNSSMILTAHHLNAGDLSLIVDEGGSFLCSGSGADVTLDSSALPQIGEREEDEGEGEERSEGMSVLLRGLQATTPGRRPLAAPRGRGMASSRSTPALSNILPPSLTSSARRPAPGKGLTRSLSHSTEISHSAARALDALPPIPPIDAEVEPAASQFPSSSSSANEPSFLAGPLPSEPSFLLSSGVGDPSLFTSLAAEPSFLLPTPSGSAGDASLLLATSEPSFLIPSGYGTVRTRQHETAGEPSFALASTSSAAGDASSLLATSEPSFLLPSGYGTARHSGPSFAAGLAAVREEPGPADATTADFLSTGEALGDMSLLNASTASFKEYRDSPVKPRMLSVQAEQRGWREEEEGKTPRPAARTTAGRARRSDVSESSGSEADYTVSTSGFGFDDLTGWRTGHGTVLFNQSPPPAALQPESTATLLIGLQSPIRPTASSIFASSSSAAPILPSASSVPSVTASSPQERDLLACSTRTVVPSTSTASAPTAMPTPASPAFPTRANVPEGDLLGIGDLRAPSPPRPAPSVLATAQAKTPAKSYASGADRLKRRLEELRAEKGKGGAGEAVGPASAASAAATPRRARTSMGFSAPSATTPDAPHPFAASRPSTAVKPSATRSLKASRSSSSLAAQAQADVRLARPRGSLAPARVASSTAAARPSTPPRSVRSSALQADGSKTPGERKESTQARLERVRAERAARTGATPGKAKATAAGPPPAATSGLARRASMAAAPATRAGRLSVGGAAGDAQKARGITASRSLSSLAPAASASTAATKAKALPRPSSALARPTSRTSLAPPPASTTASTASRPAPRQSLARVSASSSSVSAPSLLLSASSSAPTEGAKRSSAQPKLQFASMPPPSSKGRVPLRGIQPAAAASSAAVSGAGAGATGTQGKTLQRRTSRIGLAAAASGRASLAGGK
ncbi:hypothetical protein JCM10213_009232 [Rhodosporidiobolus nylandii]